MASRKQYLRTLLERYLRARKRQKGSILDEYCRNTGQNRKYAIRRTGGLATTEPRPPRKRAPHYGPDTARALEKLWKFFDFLRMGTGKNLRVGFVDMDLVLHCGNMVI